MDERVRGIACPCTVVHVQLLCGVPYRTVASTTKMQNAEIENMPLHNTFIKYCPARYFLTTAVCIIAASPAVTAQVRNQRSASPHERDVTPE